MNSSYQQTNQSRNVFTTTNEKTDGCLHSSASSAVGANPDRKNSISTMLKKITKALLQQVRGLTGARTQQPRTPLEKNRPTFKEKAGFTLVEIIVSIGIFTVVLVVAMVGLLSVIDSSRQARSQSDAVDNLNFVVDDMIRRIRTGYAFSCAGGGDCPGGADRFSFTSSEVGVDSGSNPRVTYDLGTNANGNGQIERRIGGGGMVPITSPNVDVTNLTFFVTGSSTSDNEQSRVMILIEAETGEGDLLETFSLQTTVTQRLLFNP